ncbi:MAG: hypothetical protein WEB58_00270 [Planctomycetaceae bacterium]
MTGTLDLFGEMSTSRKAALSDLNGIILTTVMFAACAAREEFFQRLAMSRLPPIVPSVTVVPVLIFVSTARIVLFIQASSTHDRRGELRH